MVYLKAGNVHCSRSSGIDIDSCCMYAAVAPASDFCIFFRLSHPANTLFKCRLRACIITVKRKQMSRNALLEHVIFWEKMNDQCSPFPMPAGIALDGMIFYASIILIQNTKIIPLDAWRQRRYLTTFMCICLFILPRKGCCNRATFFPFPDRCFFRKPERGSGWQLPSPQTEIMLSSVL